MIWFQTKKKPSGFCGLKSLGCLAWAWETCPTSRWYWRSRLQHLGFPHASPCWRQLGQLYRTKRARNQRKKGSNWGILWCCCSCSVVQKTFETNNLSKNHQKTATFQVKPSLIGALEQMRLPMDGHSVEKLYCTQNIFSQTFERFFHVQWLTKQEKSMNKKKGKKSNE